MCLVDNQGTVEARNTAVLTFPTTGVVSNLSGTTLTGGSWKAFGPATIDFEKGNITGNVAEIVLSGADSSFTVTISNTPLESTLVTNAAGGVFRILDARNYTANAGGSFVNAGQLELGGGTFDAPMLDNQLTGEIFGFGVITPQVASSGTVRAAGGTLTATGGILGNSGTVQIDAGSSLDLSNAGGDSSADFLIHNGNDLNVGVNNFLVEEDYTNASFGAGNSFDRRANVSGAGQIQAAGDVTQQLIGDVTGGDTATPSLDFGDVHVGSLVARNYRIANAGTSGPTLRGAIQTTAGGGNLTDSRLTGSGVMASNYSPIATGANSGDLAVSFDPDTSGPLTGQSVRLTNNFDNVGTQLLGITGTAWQLADPTAHTPEPIDLGIVHVGEVAQQTISLSNQAANDGFSESLNANFVGTAGDASASGSIALLAPGATDSTGLVVGIDTTSAGARNGTATVGLESDGAGTSGLGLTPLTSQTVNISAQVNQFANALVEQLAGDGTLQQDSATSYRLELGAVVRGSGVLSAELGVTNDVLAPSDELAGDFGLNAADYTLTGFGPFADISAGSTQSGLNVEFASAAAGLFNGLITLNPRSENIDGFSGDLPEIVIALSARAVFEADFDLDGDVDDTDLDLWQAGYGSGTLHADGDADGDMDVDGRDFLLWQRQFTGDLGLLAVQTAVPEPATSLLLILGMVTVFFCRCGK